MHTTIYDGVKDDHVEEYRDLMRKLQIAFNVTEEELEHNLRRVGLFFSCGSPERPYDVGLRRLPKSLMQRRLSNVC